MGEIAGHWAVWVDENWRSTFTFDGPRAVLVDYQDDARDCRSYST
jgi:toxin HigB-1